MAIKTHLYDSAEPAVEGSDLEAKCKVLVKNSVFAFMWDDTAINMKFSAETIFGTCPKCRHAELTGRYCYGIVSGEEQKQTEASA